MSVNARSKRDNRPTSGGRLDVIFLCGLVAICAVVVSAFAWARPAQARATVSYRQTGNLSYGAPTAPSSVYGRAGLSTGEPIYASQVPTLGVRYSYRLSSSAPTALEGTEQLVATISNGQGITQSIPLQPVTAFSGPSFDSAISLQLSTIESVVNTFAAAGGNTGGGSYPVEIAPRVTVHGRLGPVPLGTSFDPAATFTFSSGVLAPASSPSSTTGSSSTGSGLTGGQGSSSSSAPGHFNASTKGSVKLPGGHPTTLFGGIRVIDARIGGLVLLLAALFGGWFAARPLLRGVVSDNEQIRVATRYGSLLVDTDTLPAHPEVAVVGVSSFDGLLQVARRLELPILHQAGSLSTYAVVDNGTLYRYRAEAPHEPTTGLAVSNGKQPLDVGSR